MGVQGSEPSFLTPCPGAANPGSIWGLHTAPGTMLPEGARLGQAQGQPRS